MLKSLTAYIKIIAAFLIFSAFVEIILPDTKFRKYILMVCGLVMIAVMIKPVFTLELDLSDEIFEFDIYKEDFQGISEKYEVIRDELVREIYEDMNSYEDEYEKDTD